MVSYGRPPRRAAGYGKRYVRGDSKTFIFLSKKTERSFHMGRKPRTIRWTTIYRRVNKKGALTEDKRKKLRQKQKREQRSNDGGNKFNSKQGKQYTKR